MTNYISHHGILGQKWGVRRFQNEDGTRTAAGKARSNASNYSKDYREVAELKKKSVHELSNQELQKVITRNNLEKNYISSGKKKTNDIVKRASDTFTNELMKQAINPITTAAVAAGTAYISKHGKDMMSKVLPAVTGKIAGVGAAMIINGAVRKH